MQDHPLLQQPSSLSLTVNGGKPIRYVRFNDHYVTYIYRPWNILVYDINAKHYYFVKLERLVCDYSFLPCTQPFQTIKEALQANPGCQAMDGLGGMKLLVEICLAAGLSSVH